MKIESIHIKNYKSLRNVSLEELGNLVILIGRNSSGKSNFLEILNRFFAEIDLTGVVPPGIDNYSWFDGDKKEPIEISVTLKLDDEECEEIFPSDILSLIKEKFREKYQKLYICKQIKDPTGWQLKSIRLADIPFYEDGKPVTTEELAKSLSISLDELQAVFFTPGASNTNLVGDRLVFIKPIKKAYLMSPYADALVRDGKIKWVNVSEKTTDWRKYASEEGYALIEEGLREDHLRETPWLRSQLFSDINSKINKLKNAIKLVAAVRGYWPLDLLERPSFLDSTTPDRLRILGFSENRTEQRTWNRIEEIFNKLTRHRLEPHTRYNIRVREADLPLPIEYIGGGEQELLFLLRILLEEKNILAIEEPELHTHPQLARQIFHLLKKFSEEKQIFITTHSTVFVDHADIGTTWVVRKVDKETTITRVKESEDLKILLLDLGVKPSDIFFSDIIIFVEGKTEKVVFPILAEKVGMNLRSTAISIIPTRGKNRGKYYLNVWIDAAKSTNVPFFIIFDKEAENDKEVKEFVSKKILVENDNLFILKKGSIEDYYPQDKLIDAIQKEYEMELSEDDKKRVISSSSRAQEIENMLKEKGKDTRGWKVRIGKRVAQDMSVDEIDIEIKGILDRLHKEIES